MADVLRRNSADAESDSQRDSSLRPDALATSVAILLAVSVVQRAVGFGRGVFFCRWLRGGKSDPGNVD